LRPPARFLVPAAALAVLGTLTLTPVALADFLSPESGGSPNADAIDDLYWVLFALSVVVFLGVEGALLYSLFKFRARKGAVPAQIRGNTRLEIGWTVGAALILVVIAVVTFVQLGDIRDAPESDPEGLQLAAAPVPEGVDGAPMNKAHPPSGRSLRIRVNGLQYMWRYFYLDDDDNPLNDAFSYEELVVPMDTTVTLEITAQDVAHSWWIPRLGGKMDALPGHTNYAWFKIPSSRWPSGTRFRGQCAELCGRNHANMIAHVRAVTPQEFEQWIERRKQEIADANEAAAEQRREIEGDQPDEGGRPQDNAAEQNEQDQNQSENP
jgi:cytochrome c oxidase subunit II